MEAVAPLPRQPGSRAGLLLWGQPPLQSGLWVPAGKVTLAGGSDGVTSPGSWGCLKKPQLLLSPAPTGLVTGPTGPHLLTHPGHLVPRASVSSPGPQASPELTWPCPRGPPQPPPRLGTKCSPCIWWFPRPGRRLPFHPTRSFEALLSLLSGHRPLAHLEDGPHQP